MTHRTELCQRFNTNMRRCIGFVHSVECVCFLLFLWLIKMNVTQKKKKR